MKIIVSFIIVNLLNTYLLASPLLHNINEDKLVKINKKYGKQAKKRIILYNKMIKRLKNEKLIKQLKAINTFFNQIKFMTDKQIWKQKDRWSSPIEFLCVGAGDCEDFAIAKYFALVQLGIPKEKLKITYVKLKVEGSFKAHIVLNYYHKKSSVPIVLDNYDKRLELISKRTDLKTIYSFDASTIIKKMSI